MPIYEYECVCGFHQNYYLAINKRNQEIKCPECGKTLQKLIGKGTCFDLKGKGFFKKGIQ